MSITETIRKKETENDEIEIRLSDIVLFLKESRRRIMLGTLLGFLIGALYAFLTPDVYTAQVTVMPEFQNKGASLGGLGSLAGLAGIDIGSVSSGNIDAIRPDIYPDVLQSVPFALQVLRKPVYSQLLKKETPLQTFIDQYSKQTLIGKLFGSDEEDEFPLLDPKNRSGALQITRQQENFIKQIHQSVTAIYDKKTGVITANATFTDPVVAATVARLSLDYLTNYITSYRTEKARTQVQFLEDQLREAKKRYQMAEYNLSVYRDKNRSLYLNTAKIEEQRLQADFLLMQNVFNDLSKQTEQAKIKVAEEAPVFKILEPARIPLKKSGPKRILIILGFGVIGLVIGLVYALVKHIRFTGRNLKTA